MTAPSEVARGARATWEALDTPTVLSGGADRFDPSIVEEFPDTAARWLRRVIEPGAVLRRGARLTMRGEIKVGSWRPFTAHQVIAPGGFVWAATAGGGAMRISGFDRYHNGVGEMRWHLFGLVPVMRGSGADTSRSAAGRFAGESLVFTPAAALDAHWRSGEDAGTAVAIVDDGSFVHDIEFVVDEDGVARSVSFSRWGDPDGGSFAEHTFHVDLDGELEAGGYRLPESLHAGWHSGTDSEFFRATIDTVELF